MLMLALRAKQQIQAGANWDSIITISVSILLIVAVMLIVALVVSRIIQNRRVRRAHHRPRRRHKDKGSVL